MENAKPGPDDEAKARFESILKEKFGKPEFGALMDSIVDKLFDSMDAPDQQPEAGDEPRHP